MIYPIIKKLCEDSGVQVGVLGTTFSFSVSDFNEWIAAVAGVTTVIYTVLRCLSFLKDEKKRKSKPNDED